MRKYLLGAVSSLALVGSASAADLVPEFKSPVYQNWSGFYAGVDVGSAWGSRIWDDPTDFSFSTSYNLSGVLAGAHAGWNYQTGPIVIGGEATFAFTNARGSNSVNNEIGAQGGASFNLSTTTKWLGTLVGRGGVANGSALYYIVAGFAVMNETHEAEANASEVTGVITRQDVRLTKGGYVLGFGAEFAVYHNWTARLEYNYMDFSSCFGRTGSGCGITTSFPAIEPEFLRVDPQLHVVKLGISYMFH